MYAIGIDIGGTNTDIGLVSPAGEVVARKNLPTAQYSDANQYADDLATTIRQLIDEQKVEVKGIGIGAPNGNFYTGCIENAPNLNMKGNIYLAKMMEERLHLPAVITNDANAAAYGEMVYGGAKGMKNFIMFTLGTGVGSGIIVDGKLLYGHDGFAGELGHTIIFPDGRDCKCGRKGCLEQYTSAGGIRKTCLDMMAQDPYYDGVLSKVPAEEIDSKMIGDAANADVYSGIRFPLCFVDQHQADSINCRLTDIGCIRLRIGQKIPESVGFLFPTSVEGTAAGSPDFTVILIGRYKDCISVRRILV